MVDSRITCAKRPIALVGFMGSGKSAIGRRLAERLQLPFVDTDREIEDAFGLSVAEIFSQFSERRFRQAEREMIARLVAGDVRVLAVGGGAYVDLQTRSELNASATTVWLDPPFELIFERVARSSERPLALERSADELRKLWNERRPSYAQAHIHIMTSDTGPDETVGQIVEALS